MHAVVCHEYGPPEVLAYEEVPDPEPAAGEILIQAEAIGVNYVDTMRRKGEHPTAPQPPFIPGIEVCGRVVARGDGVSRFQEGQRVIGCCVPNGAYAELVAVEARFAVFCPEEISAEQAAGLFVNGQTAYHALFSVGRVTAGQSVLLTAAAGGVGTCAVALAKVAGAKLIAAASTPEKRDLVQQLGADVLIDYTQEDWSQQVLEATDNRGADLILESVGGEVARECLRCWAQEGRLVVFGKASGEPAVVTGDDLLFGNRSAFGLAVGSYIGDEALMRQAMSELLDWLRAGRLQVVSGGTFPLRNAAEAHRQLETRQTYGKVVLIP